MFWSILHIHKYAIILMKTFLRSNLVKIIQDKISTPRKTLIIFDAFRKQC